MRRKLNLFKGKKREGMRWKEKEDINIREKIRNAKKRRENITKSAPERNKYEKWHCFCVDCA